MFFKLFLLMKKKLTVFKIKILILCSNPLKIFYTYRELKYKINFVYKLININI